jgi:hypothetical protein
MAVRVPGVKEALDSVLEVGHAAEDAAPDGLAMNDGEPGLDLVEPAGAGRGEVQVETWMASQPGIHFGVLVGAVVVEDEVHLATGVSLGHELQEPQELLVPVTRVGPPGHLAGGDVKRGEEPRRAMANVVMGGLMRCV